MIGHEIFVPQVGSKANEGDDHIQSRIGFSSPATLLKEEDCPFEILSQNNYLKVIQCVFVDEAQFLNKKQVLGLTRISDELNIPVYAYGLRTDYKGELFEGSKYLLGWSDNLEEISTFSPNTAKKAIFNMKMDTEGNQIVEGESVSVEGEGKDFKYIPACRKTFQIKNLF
jgi:thymidine kinase